MSGTKKDHNDIVPKGVCTALKCRCSCFFPREGSPMYCAQPDCAHSIEWHHMDCREIEV